MDGMAALMRVSSVISRLLLYGTLKSQRMRISFSFTWMSVIESFIGVVLFDFSGVIMKTGEAIFSLPCGNVISFCE